MNTYSNNKYIKQYLIQCKSHGLSEGTISIYDNSLHEFVTWFESSHGKINRRWSNMKEQIIEEYLQWLDTVRKNDIETKKRKISTLKQFYKFLNRMKYFNNNPVEYFELRSESKNKIVKHLNTKEIQLLLDTIVGDRNKLITELFLNTGMRLHELVSLNIGDVENKTLKITGKGGKERIVYLNDDIYDKLHKYIGISKHTHNNTPLFLSNRGKRLSAKTIQKFMTLAEKEANLITGVHTLRHSFATNLYKNGVDLIVIKELLGHASIMTTQIYTSVATDKLKEVMNNHQITNFESTN